MSIKSTDCQAKDPKTCRYHGIVLRVENALRDNNSAEYLAAMEDLKKEESKRPKYEYNDRSGNFVSFSKALPEGRKKSTTVFSYGSVSSLIKTVKLDPFEQKWIKKYLVTGETERVKPAHNPEEYEGLSTYYRKYNAKKSILEEEVRFGETEEVRNKALQNLTALRLSNSLLEPHYQYKTTIKNNLKKEWDYVPDYSIAEGIGLKKLENGNTRISFTNYGRVVQEIEVNEKFMNQVKKTL